MEVLGLSAQLRSWPRAGITSSLQSSSLTPPDPTEPFLNSCIHEHYQMTWFYKNVCLSPSSTPGCPGPLQTPPPPMSLQLLIWPCLPTGRQLLLKERAGEMCLGKTAQKGNEEEGGDTFVPGPLRSKIKADGTFDTHSSAGDTPV